MKKIFTILILLAVISVSAQPNVATSYSEYDGTNAPVVAPVAPVNQGAVYTTPGVVFYSDRATFDVNNPTTLVETWSSSKIGPNDVVVDWAPFNSTSDNACFAAGDILPGIEMNIKNTPNDLLALATTGFLGVPIDCLGPNYFSDNLQLLFDPGVYSLGFDLIRVMDTDNYSIDVYDTGGVLIATAAVPFVTTNDFWGVSSDTPIGEIVMRSSSGNGAELIGNVAFGSAAAVPFGNWVVFMVFGIIGIVTVLRFKRII